MDLAGARAAVTGAGGFMGGALCRRLVQEGCRVAGLDVDQGAAARIEAAGAEFRRCDVTDAAAVGDALSDRSLVIHTAAIVSDWGAMDDFVRVNVGGTRNVLDAAEAAGARVVHISSVAIWGFRFSSELDDDAEPRPCGVPYIDTKGASDVLARGRGAVVVRPGDVYGPRSIPWSVRPLRALQSGRLALPRGRDGLITPVYIDDLVDCIVRAAGSDEVSGGEAFTAWSGEAVSAAEFFGHYARMLGKRVPRLPLPLLRAAVGAQELAARVTGRPPEATRWAISYLLRTSTYSTARARERLGWEPRVDLSEGMRRTEAWFREEGLLPAACG
jgi:nucleoside-diphosphate-sugar epimerase